ncbi:MAG TPA: AlpA family phage regulatory protein [Gammaproteobacteria bacterium]|jgi:prophage regulatory protein|nr:AlpA family phage regulatory protein [Gammaproteobacteria bacterium]
MATSHDDRIVREQECHTLSGLSRQRRTVLERRGDFPFRIQLSPRAVGWRLSEVRDWQSASSRCAES